MSRLRTTALLFLVFFVSFGVAYGLGPGDDARLRCQAERVARDADDRFEAWTVTVTNSGTDPLTVLGVVPTCECVTVPDARQFVLGPGESRDVAALLDPEEREPSVTPGVLIRSDDVERSQAWVDLE